MTRALSFLLVFAGCGAPAHVVSPSPRAAAPVDHALERVLTERCGACHDGDEPGRPVFDEAHELSRRDAMRVALAVSAGLMPPPPSSLPDDIRQRVIGLVCDRTALENEPASACVARLGRPAPEHWLVGMDAMKKLADRDVARTEPGISMDPARKKALDASFVLVDPDAREIRLDGSLATLIALYAAERCGDPSQVGAAAYRACVTAITDYRAMALPGPAR